MKQQRPHIGLFSKHNILRIVLKNWLLQHVDFDVVADAADTTQLLESLREQEMDILVFYSLSGEELNMETLRFIRHHYPFIKIVVISQFYTPAIVIELMDLGIYGCLNQNSDTLELLEAIHTIHRGQVHQNKIFTEALYYRTNQLRDPKHKREDVQLTDKQKRLLQLLWQGKNTNEIASEIFLSTSAVEKMKLRMKENLGVKTSIGLMKYALENKIIS